MNTNTNPTPGEKRFSLLSVILFSFAGLTLMGSVFTLIYGFSFEHGLNASTMFVQAALGPLASQIIALLSRGIQNFIFVFSGVLFLISVLLFAAGKNSRKSQKLADRVAKLEARMAVFEPGVAE